MNPEAVVISFLCFIAGVVALFEIYTPRVSEEIPLFIQIIWDVIIIVGGLTRMWGLLIQKVSTDIVGCALLGPAATIYGVLNFIMGTVSLVGGLLILGVGVMSLVRWWYYYEITRQAS